MSEKIANILFCGTGGQGILTAAEICGWAALFQGYHVKKSEVHGMAQRGGSVESHVRFGEKVFSPIIPKGDVDILVPFDEGEHDRLHAFLRADGTDLLEDLQNAAGQVADKRFLNTYLLGKLSKHLSLKEENWLKAFETVLKPKYQEENKRVFLQGRTA